MKNGKRLPFTFGLLFPAEYLNPSRRVNVKKSPRPITRVRIKLISNVSETVSAIFRNINSNPF
jgi:hypothetical protein